MTFGSTELIQLFLSTSRRCPEPIPLYSTWSCHTHIQSILKVLEVQEEMTEAILHISKASTLDEDIPIVLFLVQTTEVTSVIIQLDENSEILSIRIWLVINAKVGQTDYVNAQRED